VLGQLHKRGPDGSADNGETGLLVPPRINCSGPNRGLSSNHSVSGVSEPTQAELPASNVFAARVPRPGEPNALDAKEQNRVERSATRRGERDAAIIAVLLYAGARAQECARLDVEDIAVTARTGEIRLHGKGDEVRTVPLPAPARDRISAWLHHRGNQPGALWTGQRGALSTSGVTQVVLAVGEDAGLQGLRPHRLRHTYATRLRQGGADIAHVQALLGHALLDTSARYFRADTAEQATIIERVFDH